MASSILCLLQVWTTYLAIGYPDNILPLVFPLKVNDTEDGSLGQ